MRKMNANLQKEQAMWLTSEINRLAQRPMRIMEVCGTHTVSIFKAGIRQLLPPTIELVSGPGCPVCVTPNDYLDKAIAYSRHDDMIITTFGDMLKIPASTSSLSTEKGKGSDIRVVYSPLDALVIAKENKHKKVIFLAVGFETTAPLTAATILQAKKENITNFFVLVSHKLVPPALEALIIDKNIKVDAFILPGHVSTVIGEEPYNFLVDKYQMSGVITGFEALQILQAIYVLLKQRQDAKPAIINMYKDVVRAKGNLRALEILHTVYEETDIAWRGIGVIPGSGLKVKAPFTSFDAEKMLKVEVEPLRDHKGCRCGEVLKGLIKPSECSLFGKACIPENPIGACMVSVEGSCAAWYKYKGGRWTF